MSGIEGQQRLLAIVVGQAFSQPPQVIGQISEAYCQVQRTAIDHRSVNERGGLIQLLSGLESVEKGRSLSGSTSRTGASKFHASPVSDPLVLTWNLDGKTRQFILTSGTTCESVVKGFTANGLHGVIHVMIQELTPLHHHVTDLVVLAYGFTTDDGTGYLAGAGQWVAIVKLLRVPSYWRVKPVFVPCGQESFEGSQGGSQ